MTHIQNKNDHQKISKINGQALQTTLPRGYMYVAQPAVTPLVQIFLNHKTHLPVTGLWLYFGFINQKDVRQVRSG